METTDDKNVEYIGVFCDSRHHRTFHLNTISAADYDGARQDSSTSKSLLRKWLNRIWRRTPYLVAAFIISPNVFAANSYSSGQGRENGFNQDRSNFHVSGIVILSEFHGVIYDVLYDFMAISAIRRGGEFIRVDIDLMVSKGLNEILVRSFINDMQSDYKFVGIAENHAHFEAKLSDFED